MRRIWRFKDVTRSELECGICKKYVPTHMDFCVDIPRGLEHSENLDYLNNLYAWKCHTVMLCAFCFELSLEDQYFINRTGFDSLDYSEISPTLIQKRKLWDKYGLALPDSFIKQETQRTKKPQHLTLWGIK